MPTLNEYLPDSAQRHLAVLRAAVDDRLAALEEVLADPSRGESLEGLILDLSRVATEEAQAAAAKAVLDVQAEADKQIAEARSAAPGSDDAQLALEAVQATLEHEQAITAELRRALEQTQANAAGTLEYELQQRLAGSDRDAERRIAAAVERAVQERLATAERDTQQRVTAAEHEAKQRVAAAEKDAQQRVAQMERDKDKDLRALRQELEAEVARLRATSAELEQMAADAQHRYEQERADGADLRQLAERAQARVAALEREHHDTKSTTTSLERAQAEARKELEAERAARSKERAQLEAARNELQTQLDAERANSAQWRHAAERAENDPHAHAADSPQRQAAFDTLTAQVAAERKAAAELQKTLAVVQAHLEAERVAAATLRETADNAEKRLSSVMADSVQKVADQEQLATHLAEARAELDALRGKGGAVPPGFDGRDTKRGAPAETPAHGAKKKHSAPSAAPFPQTEPEEGWEAIRLNPRHSFTPDLEVQINGSAGRLFDISTGGCQILSPSPLKPNQVIKVAVPDGKATIACTGKVVWARLEPAKAGRPLGYRAGLSFTKRDESALEAFMARNAARS